MITKIQGYQSSNGTVHGSLPAAQKADLEELFASADNGSGAGWSVVEIADYVLSQQDRIIDILTTTSKSKPRARKINGGTKTRAKKSTRHEAEQFALPMEDSPKPAA